MDETRDKKMPLSRDGSIPSVSDDALHGVFYKVEADVQDLMTSFVRQVFRGVDWMDGAPLNWVKGRQMELRYQPYSPPFPLLTFDRQDHTSFSCVIPDTQKRCRVIANSDGALTIRTNPKDQDGKFQLRTWDLQKTAISFEVVAFHCPLLIIGKAVRASRYRNAGD